MYFLSQLRLRAHYPPSPPRPPIDSRAVGCARDRVVWLLRTRSRSVIASHNPVQNLNGICDGWPHRPGTALSSCWAWSNCDRCC
jgi:hypothetical protein